MKNPILASVLGLIFNLFSFFFFDYRLFFSSVIYIGIVAIVYMIFTPFDLPLVFFLSFNGFYALFNLYMAKLWNFFELDDTYEHKWANVFVHFTSWFLRFFAGIIAIVMIYLFSVNSSSQLVAAFKVIGVLILVPAAVFIVEKLQLMVIDAILAALGIQVKE